MATIDELISMLRIQIGDTDTEPNLSDAELNRILFNAASEYSRLRYYLVNINENYDKTANVYPVPEDSLKVVSVILNGFGKVKFIDNIDQVILEEDSLPDVDSGVLKITYIKNFQPTDINPRDYTNYLLYAEALCYKLLASKTADLIKFSTGEKSVDETEISKKYLSLFQTTEKLFRSKLVKAYGRREDNILENLNYRLPYPPEGETP